MNSKRIPFLQVTALAAVLFASQTAFAAGSTIIVTDSATPYQAQADLTLSVSLSSAIVLELSGRASSPASAITGGTDQTNAIGTGVIAFDSMNTACSPASTSGAVCQRLTNNAGARFIATIDAKVTVSGAVDAILGLSAAAPPAVIDALEYRRCGAGTTACTAANTKSYWEDPVCGGACNPVPPVCTPGCNQLATTADPILSGQTFEHQVALRFSDGDVAPGLTSVTVRYEAQPD